LAEPKGRREEPRWEFERDLQRMQKLLEILRLQYNMYFSGARKDMPVRERAEIERLFAYYRNANLPNLAQQFRFNSFANGFTLQAEQWAKFIRAKENGVVADPRMIQALRKAQNELEALERETADDLTRQEKGSPDAEAQEAEGAAKGAGKAGPAAVEKSAAKPAASPSGPASLFSQYLSARQAAGDLTTIDPGAFERQIAAQRKQIMDKYKAKDVTFAIETKDGKVSVKAKIVK